MTVPIGMRFMTVFLKNLQDRRTYSCTQIRNSYSGVNTRVFARDSSAFRVVIGNFLGAEAEKQRAVARHDNADLRSRVKSPGSVIL